MNSLHDFAGELGSPVGDHLVPETVASERVVNENVDGPIRVNSFLARSDNDGLGESIDDTVNGVVAVDFRKVSDEVGGDGAKGSVRDFVGDLVEDFSRSISIEGVGSFARDGGRV